MHANDSAPLQQQRVWIYCIYACRLCFLLQFAVNIQTDRDSHQHTHSQSSSSDRIT